MRTLLVGASGQLGSAVWERRSEQPSFIFAPPGRELDITNAAQVAAVVSEIQPTLIINCAAWIDMNGCEKDPERAYAANSDGAWNLAVGAAAIGARMIHVSTDCCDMPPGDVEGVYALSKLMGERRVAEVLPMNHTILRLSCPLSDHPNGFIAHVLRNASAGKQVHVASQVLYPTTVVTAAAAIIELALTPRNGLAYVHDDPAISKHALASLACDYAGIFRDPANPQIIEAPPPGVGAPRRVDARLRGRDYGGDWRPWLKENALRIARQEAVGASTVS